MALEQPLLAREQNGHSQQNDEECQVEEVPHLLAHGHDGSASVRSVTAALLSLQLGWGLWLFPSDYSRIGWIAQVILVILALLTAYSGTLFTRLYHAVPGVVLFSDVGAKAAGKVGSGLVSLIIYSLDATRCVILHLAATQSLRHMFPASEQPPLWQCGAVVLAGAAVLVQIRSMAEMSWVFVTGTASQLVAVAIVVLELVTNPDPNAHTEWVASDTSSFVPASVAVMNMIFAFGGQFAYTEIMGSMKRPARFPRAVNICTLVMTLLYGGLGTIGYWSRGSAIHSIVIFDLPDSPRARLAAGCILIQAAAQYLINVNVWTHNLLVCINRTSAKSNEDESTPTVRCSTDHCRWRWLFTSVFVVTYSYLISISLPFFTTLVGLVTSVTYLACAYTLPAWFVLKLMPDKLSALEKWFLVALIPLSILGSGVGLWGSIMALLNDLGGGEGWSR